MAIDAMRDVHLIFLSFIGSAFSYLVCRFLYNVYFHPLSKFPGPVLAAATKLPVAYYSWIGRNSHWLLSLHEHHQSRIVRFSPDEVNIIDAQAWNDIHSPVKATGNFQKDLRPFGPVNNVSTANDADHRRLRRLMGHAFSDKALREQERILLFHIYKFGSNVSERIPSPSTPAKIDVTEWFMFLIFDIISDLSFGASFNCQETSQYHPWAAYLMDNLKMVHLIGVTQRFPPLTRLLQHIVPKHITEGREKHTAWTAEKVDRRLNTETTRPDFLTYITRHNEEPEKGGMTKEEIYNNAAVFMGAGSETTATHITAITFFLLKHPKYHDRLQRDIRASFTSVQEISSQAVVERVPFLQAILDETFRIRPIGLQGQSRFSPPGGAMVAGHFIPEGTSIMINQYAANHSRANFSNPDKFLPERWLEGEEPLDCAKNNLDVVEPFSVGSRSCVGKNLALAQIRLAITYMLFHFDVTMVDETDSDWSNQLAWITWEKKPFIVGMQRRNDLQYD